MQGLRAYLKHCTAMQSGPFPSIPTWPPQAGQAGFGASSIGKVGQTKSSHQCASDTFSGALGGNVCPLAGAKSPWP